MVQRKGAGRTKRAPICGTVEAHNKADEQAKSRPPRTSGGGATSTERVGSSRMYRGRKNRRIYQQQANHFGCTRLRLAQLKEAPIHNLCARRIQRRKRRSNHTNPGHQQKNHGARCPGRANAAQEQEFKNWNARLAIGAASSRTRLHRTDLNGHTQRPSPGKQSICNKWCSTSDAGIRTLP